MIPVGFYLAGFLVLLTLGLDRLATQVVRPNPRPFDRTVPDVGVPYEEIEVESGGHSLAAWLLKPPQAQPFEPLVIVAHGWGAHHGVVLTLAEPLADAGHDVLLFDVHGHGMNPPANFVTIKNFRDDMMAMVRYAAKRFPDRQLVVVGHSLGGSAGVLAAAEGSPIDGLVLMASPSDVLRVTAEYLTAQGKPGGLLVNLLRPFFWRRVGSTFLPLTPSRRIRELDLPMLILQPEHDQRVAREHAERLSAAAGIEYHLVKGREHTDVLSAPETLRLIQDFLSAI